MLDFLRNNRDLVAAIASVIVAALGVLTALLKRKTSHTVRHELAVEATPPRGSGAGPRPSASHDITPGISVAGEYICLKNDSVHRSQVASVTLGKGLGGAAALVTAPLFGLLAWGAGASGEYGAAALLGVFALAGAAVASMKNVYLVTPRGPRLVAKSLFPREADRIRKEILGWRSG